MNGKGKSQASQQASQASKVFVTFAVARMNGYDPFNRPVAVPLPVKNPAVRVYTRPTCKAALALRTILHKGSYAVQMYECATVREGNRELAVTPGGMRVVIKSR